MPDQIHDIDPSLLDDGNAIATPAVQAKGSFSVSDILISAPAGATTLWVTFPYAQGAPELLKKLGGRWDMTQRSWAVPAAMRAALSEKLERITELVNLQRQVDAANGRTPSPVARPAGWFPAGPVLPIGAVTDDWIEVGKNIPRAARQMLRSLGCVEKRDAWFAKDAASAARVHEAGRHAVRRPALEHGQHPQLLHEGGPRT